MKIGYACLTVGISNTSMRSCIMKNAAPEKLRELIGHNLSSLKNMLIFNAENNIRLFRISSDLIPFGSNPVNKLKWWELFRAEFDELGDIIRKNGIRVSMHPGQYTVLNSPKKDVADRAIEDLIYHEKVLSALKTDYSSKIILHLGGVYGDKKEALKRFDSMYENLPATIKRRLTIENDDKAYTSADALEAGIRNKIPVIYDNLHSEVNPSGNAPHSYWIEACASTWGAKDGPQKIHYSQQAPGKSPGSHSATIAVKEFADFAKNACQSSPDIMLEVKDKNISAVKCINALSGDKKALLKDWTRYKYKVMELSPKHYMKAAELIGAPVTDTIDFYTVLEEAFRQTPDVLSEELAAQTIWQDFYSQANENDKSFFIEKLGLFVRGRFSYGKIKGFLLKLADEYGITGLSYSYYFHMN